MIQIGKNIFYNTENDTFTILLEDFNITLYNRRYINPLTTTENDIMKFIAPTINRQKQYDLQKQNSLFNQRLRLWNRIK